MLPLKNPLKVQIECNKLLVERVKELKEQVVQLEKQKQSMVVPMVGISIGVLVGVLLMKIVSF